MVVRHMRSRKLLNNLRRLSASETATRSARSLELKLVRLDFELDLVDSFGLDGRVAEPTRWWRACGGVWGAALARNRLAISTTPRSLLVLGISEGSGAAGGCAIIESPADRATDPRSRRTRRGLPRWLEDAERVDLALYAAIARTPTPALDRAMSRVSRAADYSKISIGAAGVLAATGGGSGRARRMGLASVGAAAALFNLVVKPP